MKNRILLVTTIAFCSLLITIPAIGQTAVLKIIKATDANVQPGQYVGVGQIVRTNPARVSGTQFYPGGEVEAALFEWGLRRAILTRKSSIQVKSFGFCFGGGRVLDLKVTGEVFLYTRQFTHRCSDIRVCFGEQGRGCASLRSTIKAKVMNDGESYIVGVKEGTITAQDYNEKTSAVNIPTGYYSIMDPQGHFSVPKKVDPNTVKILTQTKTVRVLQAPSGYSFLQGDKEKSQIQQIIGIPFILITPLE